VPTTKSTLFMVNKYTKEGHGKSIKNALYVQRYGKRHLSDVEQRKNQACSLSHGRQAGRQLVSQ